MQGYATGHGAWNAGVAGIMCRRHHTEIIDCVTFLTSPSGRSTSGRCQSLEAGGAGQSKQTRHSRQGVSKVRRGGAGGAICQVFGGCALACHGLQGSSPVGFWIVGPTFKKKILETQKTHEFSAAHRNSWRREFAAQTRRPAHTPGARRPGARERTATIRHR